MLKPSAGERFAKIRESHGLSQAELAAKLVPLHCTDQSISDFETGKSKKMRSPRWRRIAEIFGITPKALNDAVFPDIKTGINIGEILLSLRHVSNADLQKVFVQALREQKRRADTVARRSRS